MRRLVITLLAVGLANGALAVEPESCAYRVVDWNASGSADNLGRDIEVAETVIDFVAAIDANVVTLQEITTASLQHFEATLPDWDCQWQQFGVDNIAVCVKGTGENFFATVLGDYDAVKDCLDIPPAEQWWGYAQLEYEGVLITSVHTRSCWDNEHVDELHTKVTSGIVAGDFNFWTPEDPGWYQTDLDLEWTFDLDRNHDDLLDKIDHVLSVEEPYFVSGDAAGDGDPVDMFGSDHRVVLGEVVYPPEAPTISAMVLNAEQPVVVDGSCAATIDFQIAIHDECCLDPDALALEVTPINPTANVTLGPVSINAVVPIGPRDVEVTGHVDVWAVESCPAEVRIEASAQDCAGNVGDTSSQATGASVDVVDETPPAVAFEDDDVYCLWPPNHAYVCFEEAAFAPGVTDNCPSPTWSFSECASDQPDNGPGDGDTVDDCVLIEDDVCARAERAGPIKAGRRYHLGVTAEDGCGNRSPSTEIGSIHVPHANGSRMSCVAP
jgi:hypothetical protein